MKINELISNFTVFTTNEEKTVLDKLNTPCYYESFTEREQNVIGNLIRKDLVATTKFHNSTMVKRNEKS